MAVRPLRPNQQMEAGGTMKRKQRKHPFDLAIRFFEERAALYGTITETSKSHIIVSIAARVQQDAAHAAALLRRAK
jgi:hypothetical protein